MNEMDMEQARFNMIEQQIRPAEVLDPTVLHTIAEVPREFFVAAAYQQLAFSDTNIPLNANQVMMSPIQEARMLQALSVQPTDTVLEIGTGSGYVTALLAKMGKHVTSIEIDQQLSSSVAHKLRDQKITNVTLEVGDGSLPILCEDLKLQLREGGRLFAIVGSEPAMSAKLIIRINESQWSEEEMFETVIPPLINAEKPSEFVF